MALIKCKDCGRDVSTSATACPGCGAPIAPMEKQDSRGGGGGCLAVIVGGALLILILAIIGNASDPPSSTAPAASRHPFEPANQNGVALQLQIQRLINSAGERCDAVANVRGGGRTETGTAFLLADCAGGDTHAVMLTPDNQIRYYMSCESAFNPVC